MAAPVDVNVNPSSSTQASSGAGSGFGGGLTFAFGGNPNLAFLTAGPNAAPISKSWIAAGVLVVVAVGAFLWTHRR